MSSDSPSRFVEPSLQPSPTSTVDVAELVAEAVLAVPGVHALHPGVLGEVGTFLPGRRVVGVRLRPSGCEVHLVLGWGVSVPETTQAVRAVVSRLVDGTVDLHVDDLARPDEPTGPTGP